MRHKKASLNISVEAIIILILAITMLGLGLGFIRGMFGQVSTQLEQQISDEPEPGTPTGARPITLSRESIISNPGQQQVVKVSIYNSRGDEIGGSPYLSCQDFTYIGDDTDQADSEDLLPDESVNEKTIQPQDRDTFVVVFDVPGAATEGVHLCKAGFPAVPPMQYKDFTIKVVS